MDKTDNIVIISKELNFGQNQAGCSGFQTLCDRNLPAEA